MLIAAILIAIATLEQPYSVANSASSKISYAQKRRKVAAGNSSRKFSSCATARKAGYSHMRRGQKGYSASLDRDGAGVACDKMR